VIHNNKAISILDRKAMSGIQPCSGTTLHIPLLASTLCSHVSLDNPGASLRIPDKKASSRFLTAFYLHTLPIKEGSEVLFA
jgi:hypothetical protein